MFTDGFDQRTKANLQVALTRACERLGPNGAHHEARSFIASKLLACADGGQVSLGALTEAGLAAVIELNGLTDSPRETLI